MYALYHRNLHKFVLRTKTTFGKSNKSEQGQSSIQHFQHRTWKVIFQTIMLFIYFFFCTYVVLSFLSAVRSILYAALAQVVSLVSSRNKIRKCLRLRRITKNPSRNRFNVILIGKKTTLQHLVFPYYVKWNFSFFQVIIQYFNGRTILGHFQS